MAEIDSILSSIVFLVIALVVISVSFVGFSSYQERELLNTYNNFHFQSNLETLNTVLSIQDFYSQDQYLFKIFNILNGQEYYETIYGTFRNEDSLKFIFDKMFGEENYYLRVTPNLPPVAINILLDYSPFMIEIIENNDIIEYINQIYEEFSISLENEFSVNVHLLAPASVSSLEIIGFCSQFNQGINCEHHRPNHLYLTPISRPFPFSHNNWVSDLQRIISENNDWIAFSHRVISSYDNLPPTDEVRMFIPFIDSVVFGGANESFFRDIGLRQQWQMTQYPQRALIELSAVYSFYCTENTGSAQDMNTSNSHLESIVTLLSSRSTEFYFPVVIVNEDHFSQTNQDLLLLYAQYVKGNPNYFEAQLNGGNPSTVCGAVNCRGCFQNQTHSIFQKNTVPLIFNQAQLFSNSGLIENVINFNENNNLFDIVEGAIDEVTRYLELTLGEQQSTSRLTVIQREFSLLSQGQSSSIRLHLEVYDNPYTFTQNPRRINIEESSGDLKINGVGLDVNLQYCVGSMGTCNWAIPDIINDRWTIEGSQTPISRPFDLHLMVENYPGSELSFTIE